jgi:biopolymer transport protein ExbB/TolQ
MLANSGAILCFRLYLYNAVRSHSRSFIRDAASLLREGKFDEVVAIAARNSRSHVASIFAESFVAYASSPSRITDTEATAAAQRASQRSSKFLAAHLQRGLNTIANIAASAPFVGFLGTINLILGSFTGTTGPRSASLARLASGIAEALGLGAMGLLVSLLAVWCFNHLRCRFEAFESEMSTAGLQAITYLKAHPQRREEFEQSFIPVKVFGVGNTARAWEVPYDRQRPLLLALWCGALYLAYAMVQSWLFR